MCIKFVKSISILLFFLHFASLEHSSIKLLAFVRVSMSPDGFNPGKNSNGNYSNLVYKFQKLWMG